MFGFFLPVVRTVLLILRWLYLKTSAHSNVVVIVLLECHVLLKTAVLIRLCIVIMTAGLVSLKHGISRYMYSLCTCLCACMCVCAWMHTCVYYPYVVPSYCLIL